jgi:hypothetical protein
VWVGVLVRACGYTTVYLCSRVCGSGCMLVGVHVFIYVSAFVCVCVNLHCVCWCV